MAVLQRPVVGLPAGFLLIHGDRVQHLPEKDVGRFLLNPGSDVDLGDGFCVNTLATEEKVIS